MLEKNLHENEDHTWQIRMKTLMQRKRNMEIAQIIDEALEEYYSSIGKPVPNWKTSDNDQWWIEYLKELGIDPSNP